VGAVDADVYLMPATTDDNIIVVGGFHRIGIDLDAGAVSETHAYTRSCMQFDKREIPRGHQGLFMWTHLTSATPPEVYVFQSLVHRTSFMVVTYPTQGQPGIGWEVDRGAIRRIVDDE
jgi:hypothetical protein